MRDFPIRPSCDTVGIAAFLRGGGNALVQAATQLEAITNNQTPLLFPTTDSIILQELVARSGATHVIMVRHSQGNLFTIQAIRTLEEQARAPADSDAACFGVVPTASPTSVGYPTNTWRVAPVQIAGDAILALDGPKFPATRTRLGDSLAVFVPPTANGDGGWAAALALVIANSLKLHEFVSAYLNPSGARDLVKSALKEVYSQCEVALTISAQPTPLQVGNTHQLVLQITGADQRVINGAGLTRWTSSDTSVATVDQTGLVQAVGSGEALITATYRGKTVAQVIPVSGSGLDPAFIIAPPIDSTDDVRDPFGFDVSRIWRRQLVTVQIAPTDSSTYITDAQLFAIDTNGAYYFFGAIPYGSGAFDSTTAIIKGLFYDNPRERGVSVKLGDRYWIIRQLYARLTLHVATGEYRTFYVPVSNP
jgi:hypothetical protein